MSLLLLSLLLLVLIGLGMLMNRRKIHEMFDNPTTVTMSPALANLMAGIPKDLTGPTSQPDTLGRDQEAVAAANAVGTAHKCPTCPACPSCPTCPKCEKCEDMSKYIRMDEIPCWNCTLP